MSLSPEASGLVRENGVCVCGGNNGGKEEERRREREKGESMRQRVTVRLIGKRVVFDSGAASQDCSGLPEGSRLWTPARSH